MHLLLATGESLSNCLRVGYCHKVFKFSHLMLLYNQDWEITGHLLLEAGKGQTAASC